MSRNINERNKDEPNVAAADPPPHAGMMTIAQHSDTTDVRHDETILLRADPLGPRAVWREGAERSG